MESSQLFGGSEKCSSGESGWTSYIVSLPSRDVKKNDEEERKKYNGTDDSDDSLASDASSGPSHLELSCENREGVHFKREEHENTSKYRSSKKAHKQVKKEHAPRRTEVTEEDGSDDYKDMLNASKFPSPVQSAAKVRKNNRKSK